MKNVIDLKNLIKELSERQRLLRSQRKTVHLKGERIINPWEATIEHRNNRNRLRVLFYAYAILRDKEPGDYSVFPPLLNSIIEQYQGKVYVS